METVVVIASPLCKILLSIAGINAISSILLSYLNSGTVLIQGLLLVEGGVLSIVTMVFQLEHRAVIKY